LVRMAPRRAHGPLMRTDIVTDTATAPSLLDTAIAQIAAEVDAEFDQLLTVPADARAPLYHAMRHAAIGGGKRLRPLLLVATAELFNVARATALRVATAVEAIHVYSLVHDDLPCMDDDDLRRGKPTVHRAFDEATAVLAGDSLHALAFEILSDTQTHADPFVRSELIATLALASGPDGMAGGQMMDLEAEKASFDLPTVTRLQALKTGALIAASVEMGAILGHIPAEGRTHLRGYARDIGLAFQIADDILDVEGDEALAGKALQKDAAAGKGTFVSLMGLERAKQQAAMLVEQSLSHLAGYGSEADLLRAIAHYVLERDH
jgi:farnesyl diphosphate synthase